MPTTTDKHFYVGTYSFLIQDDKLGEASSGKNPSTNLGLILSSLQNAKLGSNGTYYADCPAHPGELGGFVSITETDNGKPSFSCSWGCQERDIWLSLGARGSSTAPEIASKAKPTASPESLRVGSVSSTQVSGDKSIQPGPSEQWQRVVDVLVANYANPDLQAARAICAAVAAHALKDYPPVWVLAIAPPGSMKTDLLESLRGLPRVFFVDEVSPNTFISGKVDEQPKKRREAPASLLHRIGNDGIVVAADFSTYTADSKKLPVVLSQLRRIYDGNYSREFGTEEHLEERGWQGRLTFFAGAVPQIDRHYETFQKLGERFSRVRWERAAGVEAGLKAMKHTGELAEELRQAVQDLLLPVLSGWDLVPVITSEQRQRIACLGELVALARSHVPRDRYTRLVDDVPITEGNTRLPQQLCQIARGSALLDGRKSVNEGDFELACRAALDSMPAARRAVLDALIRGQRPYETGSDRTVVRRALEDFQLVGLTTSNGEARLTEKAKSLVQQSQLVEDVPQME